MTMMSAGRKRSGFTLLEVMLASAIAIVLMGALYYAMQLELQQASAGRDVVARSTLARAIINRITIDLTPSMTPRAAASNSGSTGGSASAGASASASPSASSTASSASSSSTAQTAQQLTSYIPLQAGLIGDNGTLTIFTTRVSDVNAVVNSANNSPDVPFPSDIRRVSYWLGDGGLCRREVPWFSTDQLQNSADPNPDGQDEQQFVIAREVVDLTFEYYDVNSQSDDSGWNSSWDGSSAGPDGSTPMGPPTAIRVTFTIKNKDGSTGGETTKQYSHVIPLVTASGPTVNSNSNSNSNSGAGSSNSGGNQPSQ